MRFRCIVAALALAGPLGCDRESVLEFPGSTDWDRVTVLAEASERVLGWSVAEGERVEAGALLLRLDGSRYEVRLAEAQHRLAEADARLAELRSGPRVETIARARAELASAEAGAHEAELEYQRVANLLAQSLTSQSSVDQALAARDQRRAAVAAAQAALEELLAGTRHEQIEQAEARSAATEAELGELRLTRERLDVRTPRAGRVDALPFKPGDQPRAGDIVASLLVGDAPIARIFVPASARAQFSEGDAFDVRVEGLATTLRGTIRNIRSEASFTPYYALTGNDAARLVYRAELLLDGPGVANLPAGLPLVAIPLQAPTPGD